MIKRNRLLILILVLNSTALIAQQPLQDSINTKLIEVVKVVGDNNKSTLGAGHYIGVRMLEKLNQPNINNVLRLVTGVNVRDEEGFGLRPNIGLRGTPVNRSAKITLMEDGILIAPATYADPSAYYFPTFARMQALEVLKGSSQLKYGPHTIGGVLNLLSTTIPSSFKGFAQVAYGSFNTNQQRLWIGDSRKKIDYLVEINRLASNGFKEIDNGGNTGFDRRDIMAKIRWHNSKTAKFKQTVALKILKSTEDGNETYLGLTYDDYKKKPNRRYSGTQLDRLDMYHQHVNLSHTISLLKGLSINTTAYYSKTFRSWARGNTFGGQSINNILNNPMAYQTGYNIMTGEANGTIVYQSTDRTYFSKGVQINANYIFNGKNVMHKLQFGIRQHKDQADRFATQSNYQITNGKMLLTGLGIKGNQENQIRNAKSTASYFTYEVNYKNLKLSSGIRHEIINFNFDNYGIADNQRVGNTIKSASNKLMVFLPGLGLNYKLNNYGNIFVGVHKGFSPPGMPSVTSTNGQAKPELSVNYELGYRYEKGAANLQITSFINNYGNILGSDNVSGGGAANGDLFNAGNASVQGLEISIVYDFLYKKNVIRKVKIPFALAYTYTDAKFKQTFVNGGGDWGSGTITKNDFIPFITPHLLTASIGFENKKFDATLIARYTGKTRIKPGQNENKFPAQDVSLANINTLKDFLILDLSANYKWFKNYATFILINNVTNNKAIIANLPQGYRPNMPISFNFGIKAHF